MINYVSYFVYNKFENVMWLTMIMSFSLLNSLNINCDGQVPAGYILATLCTDTGKTIVVPIIPWTETEVLVPDINGKLTYNAIKQHIGWPIRLLHIYIYDIANQRFSTKSLDSEDEYINITINHITHKVMFDQYKECYEYIRQSVRQTDFDITNELYYLYSNVDKNNCLGSNTLFTPRAYPEHHSTSHLYIGEIYVGNVLTCYKIGSCTTDIKVRYNKCKGSRRVYNNSPNITINIIVDVLYPACYNVEEYMLRSTADKAYKLLEDPKGKEFRTLDLDVHKHIDKHMGNAYYALTVITFMQVKHRPIELIKATYVNKSHSSSTYPRTGLSSQVIQYIAKIINNMYGTGSDRMNADELYFKKVLIAFINAHINRTSASSSAGTSATGNIGNFTGHTINITDSVVNAQQGIGPINYNPVINIYSAQSTKRNKTGLLIYKMLSIFKSTGLFIISDEVPLSNIVARILDNVTQMIETRDIHVIVECINDCVMNDL